METLSTIAVGGVAAGEMLTGRGSACQVYHTQPISIAKLVEPDGPQAACTARQTIYQRMRLRYQLANGDERVFEFWVDRDEIRNEFDLIVALANGYRPVLQRSL